MLGVLVEREVEMFGLASKDRQRECVVFKMVSDSIPSRWSSITNTHRQYVATGQSEWWDIWLAMCYTGCTVTVCFV